MVASHEHAQLGREVGASVHVAAREALARCAHHERHASQQAADGPTLGGGRAIAREVGRHLAAIFVGEGHRGVDKDPLIAGAPQVTAKGGALLGMVVVSMVGTLSTSYKFQYTLKSDILKF